ncbi:MAG: hypothetical protein K6L81_08030 [Agarilytica sp.]
MNNSADFDVALLVKLVALKAVTMVVSCLVVTATYLYFDVSLPYAQLITTLFVSAGLVFVWMGRLAFRVPVTEFEIFVLLVSDVVVLSLLIEQSGGSANPFTSSLLVPLALSAALLQKAYSLVIALIAVVIYANWTFGGEGHHMDHSKFSLHLYGMWINFLISAAILFVFITYAMDSVRRRESQLRSAREKILHDEQIVAVATLTATTAHALGSPLSTMAILVDEWAREGKLDAEKRVFKEQLDICKQYLAGVGSASSGVKVSQQTLLSVAEFYEALRDHFQLLRPASSVVFTIDESIGSQNILQNRSLLLALVNLIENALQSGGDAVKVNFRAGEAHLYIDIIDNGEGMSPGVKNSLGQPFISSKKGGWGLGVYLSNSTIEQFGGKISVHDGVEHGTEMLVEIALQADANVSTADH